MCIRDSFRHGRIIRAHPKNGVFAGFIEVDELVIDCNHSFFHLTQAAGCTAILMLNRLDSDVSTNCSDVYKRQDLRVRDAKSLLR